MTTARLLRVLVPGLIVAGLASLPMTAQTTPTISIADQAAVEGNSGQKDITFNVRLSTPSPNPVQVNYIAQPGTATAGVLSTDFTSAGPITLPDSGPASAYPIIVNTSGIGGPIEDIIISLDGLTHPSPGDLDMLVVTQDGRTFVPMAGVGGNVAVNNLTFSMHDSGQRMSATGPLVAGTVGPTSVNANATFPSPAPQGPYPHARPAGSHTIETTFRGGPFSSPWAVFLNDRRAGGGPGSLGAVRISALVSDPTRDIAIRAGIAYFAPGTTSQQIRVTVNGDTTVEAHETFRVNLLAPLGASLADGQADGTILNDDGGTAPTAVDDAYQIGAGGRLQRPGFEGLLVNDLTNGTGQLSALLATGPSNGTVAVQSNGAFDYTPNPGFVGTDTFSYFAINNNAFSVATVTIAVTQLTQPSGPSGLYVGDLRPDRTVMRWREGPVYQARNHSISGGVLPNQPLVNVATGSADPIAVLENVPAGSFYVSVQAIDANGQLTPRSNEIRLNNTTAIAPSAPRNALVTVADSTIYIAWQKGYLGGIPTGTTLHATGSATGSIPLGNTETVSFAGVPPGTYNLSLDHTNAAGTSAAASIGSVTIPGTCGAPLTPENFLLYVRGVVLGAIWDLPASGPAPIGYDLHVTSTVFTGSVPLTSRGIEVPAPAGTYQASVSARTTCGTSPRTPAQIVVIQ